MRATRSPQAEAIHRLALRKGRSDQEMTNLRFRSASRRSVARCHRRQNLIKSWETYIQTDCAASRFRPTERSGAWLRAKVAAGGK